MTIRQATGADLIWIRMLYAAVLHEHPPIYPTHDDTDLTDFTTMMAVRLGVDPTLLCYVAEDPEARTLVGFLLGEFVTRPIGHPRHYILVHWLYVVPAHRGAGIGRQLSAAGLVECRHRGVEAAELAAQPGDPQWLNRGWVPTSTTFVLPLAAVAATLVSKEHPNGSGIPTEL